MAEQQGCRARSPRLVTTMDEEWCTMRGTRGTPIAMEPSTSTQKPSPSRESRGQILDGRGVAAWSLSRDSLSCLLEQLDPDPRQAAFQYERVRAKLVKLFEWRGCRFSEDLADETIDRVARKIEGGVEIRAEDPYRYFCSVAFFVFKEVMAERRREALAHQSGELEAMIDRGRGEEAEDEVEALMPCLDSCLESLTPRTRELILEYHSGEKQARIDRRVRLAEELQTTVNNLRQRVHRIRLKLETCVVDCNEGRGAK